MPWRWPSCDASGDIALWSLLVKVLFCEGNQSGERKNDVRNVTFLDGNVHVKTRVRRPHSTNQKVVQGKCSFHSVFFGGGAVCSNTLLWNTSASTNSLSFRATSPCKSSRTPRLVEHFWVPILGGSCSNKTFGRHFAAFSQGETVHGQNRGRFGSFFVLCFLALGGHCLQMLCLPGFGTHANTQNRPHFRAFPAIIQEQCPPKCLFFMANAKLPNRPGFALLQGETSQR